MVILSLHVAVDLLLLFTRLLYAAGISAAAAEQCCCMVQVNFFAFVAQEVRIGLARLGMRSLDELVGRADLLRQKSDLQLGKTSHLDMSFLTTYAGHEPGDSTQRRNAKVRVVFMGVIVSELHWSTTSQKLWRLDHSRPPLPAVKQFTCNMTSTHCRLHKKSWG